MEGKSFNYVGIVDRILSTASHKINAWEYGFLKTLQKEEQEGSLFLTQTRKSKIKEINRKVLRG